MRLFFASLLFSLFSGSIYAQESNDSFLYEQESEIQHEMVGNLTIAVLEDFREISIEPALVLAIEENVVLVKRNDQLALLVPKADFENVVASGSNPFIVFASQCSRECTASAVAGAIGGAVAGAGSGATIGAPLGPQGVGGGAVIGGLFGGIGGGMGGWEACRIATRCDKFPMTAGKGSK